MKNTPKKWNDKPFQMGSLERVWNGGTFHPFQVERFGTISDNCMKINEEKWNGLGSVLERATPRSAPPVS